MKGFLRFIREILGFIGVMTGLMLLTQPVQKGTAFETIVVVLLVLMGWWEFVFRHLWLNWIESPELVKNFSPERIDRPIPFTFRCSELRFHSALSPEELQDALDREIAGANEMLAPWHEEEKGTFSWKAEWKLEWKKDKLKLTCIRSAKAKGAWERVHGALFLGKLIPWEEGCLLQGHFGQPLAMLLWPALWLLPGWILGGTLGAILGIAPIALHVLLKDLGRGSYGVDELTVETQKALIHFLGRPEIIG